MILQTVKKIIQGLSNSPKFFYADLFEANIGLDKEPAGSYPLVVYIPPTSIIQKIDQSGVSRLVFPFRVWFLDRSTSSEPDPTSEQTEEIIQAQLLAGQQFFADLAREDELVDANQVIEEVVHNPIRMKFDALIHGIDATAQISVRITQPKIC